MKNQQNSEKLPQTNEKEMKNYQNSEKLLQTNNIKYDHISKVRTEHKLYANPFLQKPERFVQISQRIRKIQSFSEKKDELTGIEAEILLSPVHLEKGIEKRDLDVPFTTLILIHEANGEQHNFFREHCFTDYRRLPFQGQYHRHDFIELFLVIEGSFEQILLGEKRHFSAGEIVITDKSCEHADVITEETGTILFLWIQPEFLDQILRYYDGTDSLQRFLFQALRTQRSGQSFLHLQPEKDSTELEYILEQLVYEDYTRGPGSRDIIKWNLLRLFHLLCEQYALRLYSSRQESKEKVLLYEIERYIGLHLAEVTVQDLEEHFHYHRNYYNLLLKKYLDQSFREYVQNLRMDQAARLLVSGELTVKQVAEQVGYENSSFFYHLFERHFHMGPLEYKHRREHERRENRS